MWQLGVKGAADQLPEGRHKALKIMFLDARQSSSIFEREVKRTRTTTDRNCFSDMQSLLLQSSLAFFNSLNFEYNQPSAGQQSNIIIILKCCPHTPASSSFCKFSCHQIWLALCVRLIWQFAYSNCQDREIDRVIGKTHVNYD